MFDIINLRLWIVACWHRRNSDINYLKDRLSAVYTQSKNALTQHRVRWWFVHSPQMNRFTIYTIPKPRYCAEPPTNPNKHDAQMMWNNNTDGFPRILWTFVCYCYHSTDGWLSIYTNCVLRCLIVRVRVSDTRSAFRPDGFAINARDICRDVTMEQMEMGWTLTIASVAIYILLHNGFLY